MAERIGTFVAALGRARDAQEGLERALARRRLDKIESRLATLANFDAALRLAIRSVEELVGRKAASLEEALALLRERGREEAERAAGADPELARRTDAELDARLRACRETQRELEARRLELALARLKYPLTGTR